MRTGTLFGAISLITGSTVGAGMLALPEVTAPAGFIPTAAGLCLTWVLLAAEALLMAEVNLALLERAKPKDAGKIVTLRQMAQKTLGKSGKVVTVIYLLLSYCLLVAYLAKSSEVLDFFAGNALPPPVAAGMLCIGTAALFLVGGPSVADRMNQGFTSALFVLFAIILGTGVTHTDIPTALATGHASWPSLGPAVPIIFLSLVYHDLVPVICTYLGGNRQLVRTALLVGSLVPLGMFLSWEAVALALVPSDLVSSFLASSSPSAATAGVVVQEVGLSLSSAIATTNDPTAAAVAMLPVAVAPVHIDPLQVFVRKSGPGVGLAVECFSFLAVITSFTATVMGLSETLFTEVPPLVRTLGSVLDNDELASYDGSMVGSSVITSNDSSEEEDLLQQQQQGFGTDPGRVLALALTLGPPLAFTAQNPGAFLAVLSVAGGYGMTALYGIMPPLMAWNLREKQASSSSSYTAWPALLPGGGPVLAGVLVAATGVGLTRAAVDYDGAMQVLASSKDVVAQMPAMMTEMMVSLFTATAVVAQ